MNICITGISGYLGSALAYKLVRDGFCVTGIGSSIIRPLNIPNNITYYGIDIRNREALANVFKSEEINVVYHFAGIKYIGKCEEDSKLCFAINTSGTEAVLEAMEKASVPHIVYASTYAVYDWSFDKVILSEDSALNPSTVYGESKKRSEHLIENAFNKGSIECFQIFRYGNIIGATPDMIVEKVQSFLDRLIYATRHNIPVTIFGLDYNTEDGSVARDFIDIRDVIEINYLVLENLSSGIYNISTGSITSLLKMVKIVEKETKKKINLEISVPTKLEPSSISIDNKKATVDFFWFPKYSFEETIKNLNERSVY